MADPRNELADIIGPVAPPLVATGDALPAWLLPLLAALLAGVAIALWLRRRGRLARVLRDIARDAAHARQRVPELAARLDAWARARFRLGRVEPAVVPPGLDTAAWSAWAEALAALRFAPEDADGYAKLASLCDAARRWSRRG